eukprot:c17047_g1_i4.p1 GENE.c17047_g1_i4~~c17047_g1_i4.p1  ORF type:complete len:357 (-),score=53.87 c17047_g1_i4:26-1096(-)
MAHHSQVRFGIGEKGDATEAYEELLTQLTARSDKESVRALIKSFQITLESHVICETCDQRFALPTTKAYVHRVSVPHLVDLLSLPRSISPRTSFAALLRILNVLDAKSAHDVSHHCKAECNLKEVPEVFALSLMWPIDPSQEMIAKIAGFISPDLPLNMVFGGAESTRSYSVFAMVCFYGRHYVAFVISSGLWTLVDDTHIRTIGIWRDLVAEIRAARYQPVLMLYHDAPQETQPVPALSSARGSLSPGRSVNALRLDDVTPIGTSRPLSPPKVVETIPCEFCGRQIAVAEFQDHTAICVPHNILVPQSPKVAHSQPSNPPAPRPAEPTHEDTDAGLLARFGFPDPFSDFNFKFFS